jgi:cholesterol transport system auxiliary component
MLAMLLLGACSILTRTEPPAIYRLPAASVPPATDMPDESWSLRIDAPAAGALLDSNRLAVLPDGNRITVYQGARWSDRVPLLLRDRLFDAFQASGRIHALSIDDSNRQADLALGGNLRAFQSEYQGGRPVVVIRYDAQLVRTTTQRIVAARRFDVRVPVDGKAVPQVVQAFGTASDRLAAEVMPWAIAAGRQAMARSSETSD